VTLSQGGIRGCVGLKFPQPLGVAGSFGNSGDSGNSDQGNNLNAANPGSTLSQVPELPNIRTSEPELYALRLTSAYPPKAGVLRSKGFFRVSLFFGCMYF
jgi:hypothetical protein